jgi:selenide,water dikinase
VHRFTSHFDDLLARVSASSQPLTVAVVGGGAGGVELALALAYRLRQERSKPGTQQQHQPDQIRWVGHESTHAHAPEINAANVPPLCRENISMCCSVLGVTWPGMSSELPLVCWHSGQAHGIHVLSVLDAK